MRVAVATAAVRAEVGRGVLAIGASSLHLAVQSATGADASGGALGRLGVDRRGGLIWHWIR